MSTDASFESDDAPPVAPFLWMPVWLAAMLHCGAWLTFGYWLVGPVGAMKDVFTDFAVAVPRGVEMFLNLSDFAVNYWQFGLFLLLLFGAADAWLDRTLLVNSQFVYRTLWFILGFVPPAGLLLVGMITVYAAFFGFWRTLGSPP